MGRSVEEIRNDITNGEHLWGSSLVLPGSRRYWLTVPPPLLHKGSYEWENRLENGIWTYSLEDIWKGLRSCYQDLAADVKSSMEWDLHRSALWVSVP